MDAILYDKIETEADKIKKLIEADNGGFRISPYGQWYKPKTVIPNDGQAAVFPQYGYRGCTDLEEFVSDWLNTRTLGQEATLNYFFFDCSVLKKVVIKSFLNDTFAANMANTFSTCPLLTEVTLGSVGHPIKPQQNINSNAFSGTAQRTITFYVDAENLATVPTEFTTNQPWGSTNATVIYRSATTGEVLT